MSQEVTFFKRKKETDDMNFSTMFYLTHCIQNSVILTYNQYKHY